MLRQMWIALMLHCLRISGVDDHNSQKKGGSLQRGKDAFEKWEGIKSFGGEQGILLFDESMGNFKP